MTCYKLPRLSLIPTKGHVQPYASACVVCFGLFPSSVLCLTHLNSSMCSILKVLFILSGKKSSPFVGLIQKNSITPQ